MPPRRRTCASWRRYDALKAAAPDVRVWGGALAPRGVDRPNTGRDTISPTRFLRELGQAYRASGRALPVMDGFSFHPYPLNSSVPVDALPSDPDHLGLIDQDVLVRLLGKAFDGTAQVGSGMPILYDEFGIESAIPADKRELYGGVEPATTRPVAETAQAAAYRRAIQLAYCQSNVAGMLLFHTHDEAEPAGLAVRARLRGRLPQDLARARPAAMEQRERAPSAPARIVAKVSTAFTTAQRTISLRCERACTYKGPTPAPAAPDAGGDDDRPRGGRAAPPGPARAAREHARLVSAGGLVRRRGASRPARRARQHALCGALLLAAALLGGCGGDGSDRPALLVGAVDDSVRHEGPALEQLQDAGFGAVGITSFWQPGAVRAAGGGDRDPPRA